MEYLVDFLSWSMIYSNFRWANGLTSFRIIPDSCICVLKLLFSRSRKEDTDETEDEVDPEMMIGDVIDTPCEEKGLPLLLLILMLLLLLLLVVSRTGGKVFLPDDTRGEEGSDREERAGCCMMCIVLYVKRSEEAWIR